MSIAERTKRNSRAISDAVAGTRNYFELATTNLALCRALDAAFHEHVRGRVLDAGAGRMAYRSLIEARCEKYESLDVTEAPGVDHVADLQDTGLPDETYDTIVCTQVLQHLPEPARAVAEIGHMLKPGGKAIISVPHLVWLHNEPHDYMRFTQHGMRFLLEKAGLTMIQSEPVGGLICFLAYAPSTVVLALLWPIRPLFRLALLANKLFIRLALVADRFFGAKGLYPTNVLVIAEKPEKS